MAFRHGTNIAKIEFAVGTLPPSKIYVCTDGAGEIPPNLADITQLIIQTHIANKDLGWLEDMISDARKAGVQP